MLLNFWDVVTIMIHHFLIVVPITLNTTRARTRLIVQIVKAVVELLVLVVVLESKL